MTAQGYQFHISDKTNGISATGIFWKKDKFNLFDKRQLNFDNDRGVGYLIYARLRWKGPGP